MNSPENCLRKFCLLGWVIFGVGFLRLTQGVFVYVCVYVRCAAIRIARFARMRVTFVPRGAVRNGLQELTSIS